MWEVDGALSLGEALVVSKLSCIEQPGCLVIRQCRFMLCCKPAKDKDSGGTQCSTALKSQAPLRGYNLLVLVWGLIV